MPSKLDVKCLMVAKCLTSRNKQFNFSLVKITPTVLRQTDFQCSQEIIEGFGGKRALGFLLKSELCQKRSKFRMQFCLGALNNVLYVFSLKFASFSRYYVCKKTCICCHVSA